MKICGNKKCRTSTGIHDGPTHGWGDLDPNGFWEHECGPCTRAELRLDKERARTRRWKAAAKHYRAKALMIAEISADFLVEASDIERKTGIRNLRKRIGR